MGELSEIYRDHKDYVKTKKATNLAHNMRVLNDAGVDYEVYNNGYHLKIQVTIDFYPSTNVWMIGKKKYTSPAEVMLKQMEGGIKKHG